ncbi:MAG: helix-turn-helix domain-containing protein [Fusobacteria bacterium]|nr:helix-turn-helix domain-containing protein [Fusobacteriota bacterium]
MKLKIKDIMELLNVSEKTVYRWIKDSKIPAYKINGQYRFNELEINEWMLKNKLKKHLEISQSVLNFGRIHTNRSISEMMEKGKFIRTEKNSISEIVKHLVESVKFPKYIQKEILLEEILERVDSILIDIGEGIAISNPKYPVIVDCENEEIITLLLEKSFEFDVLDTTPLHTIFFIFSANYERHLETLNKLTLILQNPKIVECLKVKDSVKIKEEILQTEQSWASGGEK